MKHELATRGLRGALAFTVLLLHAGFAAEVTAQSASSATRERPDYIVGTVRAVDTEARTLEVIAGAGYALRVVRLEVASDCEFRVPGAAPQLASVTRGAFVRVACVAASALARTGAVAVVIEAIEIGESGATR
jgi:hypothetical protein